MLQLIVAYTDCTSKTETTDSIILALNAARIYIEDPDCVAIKIWDDQKNKFILDWSR